MPQQAATVNDPKPPMAPPSPLAPPPEDRADPEGHIYVRLWELCVERGVVVQEGPHRGRPNTSAIANGTGIAYTTLIPLLKDPAGQRSMSFGTLIRLCEYFQCEPGDLLEYRPGPAPRPQLKAPSGSRKPRKPWQVGAPGTRPAQGGPPPNPASEVESTWE